MSEPTELHEEELDLPIEGSANEADEEVEVRKFTQAELDRHVTERLAREQRKHQRIIEGLKRSNSNPPSEIRPEDFPTTEAYLEARAEQIAELKVQTLDQDRKFRSIEQNFKMRVKEFTKTHPDFEEVAIQNDVLVVTPVMGDAIKRSKVGPSIAYYLGQNPDEALDIAEMDEIDQIRKIGRLEAKFVKEQDKELPSKPVTKTPSPVSPLNTTKAPNLTTDVSHPDSANSMSTTDWIEARRRQIIEKSKLNLVK